MASKKTTSKKKTVKRATKKKLTKKKVVKIKSKKTIVAKKNASLAIEKIGETHPSASGPVYTFKYHKQTIYVLGTAHVSQESINDVEKLIKKINPGLVCVELCESRYNSFRDKKRWEKLDIVQVIKEKKIYLLMSSVILSAFQKKLGDDNKVKPGAELMAAVQIAEDTKKPLELIDRDVQVTLKRTWQALGYFTKMFAFSELLTSLFYSGGVDNKEIEKMKNKDALESLFDSLPTRMSKVKEIIVTERDKYLSQKLKDSANAYPKAKKILAVVGAGHLPGIAQYFSQEQDIASLETLKKKSKLVGAIKFFLPIVLIMGAFWAFSSNSNIETIKKSIGAWIIIKASFSGLASLILWAHPLAILAAALSAPISNFNPVLKPGWVAALIEAKFRKPNVGDFEKIADDTRSLKGIYKNKVLRIFAVFMLPQLASSLGTGVALWYILKYI